MARTAPALCTARTAPTQNLGDVAPSLLDAAPGRVVKGGGVGPGGGGRVVEARPGEVSAPGVAVSLCLQPDQQGEGVASHRPDSTGFRVWPQTDPIQQCSGFEDKPTRFNRVQGVGFRIISAPGAENSPGPASTWPYRDTSLKRDNLPP